MNKQLLEENWKCEETNFIVFARYLAHGIRKTNAKDGLVIIILMISWDEILEDYYLIIFFMSWSSLVMWKYEEFWISENFQEFSFNDIFTNVKFFVIKQYFAFIFIHVRANLFYDVFGDLNQISIF